MVIITICNVFVTSGFATSLIQKKDADDIDFSTVFYFGVVFIQETDTTQDANGNYTTHREFNDTGWHKQE